MRSTPGCRRTARQIFSGRVAGSALAPFPRVLGHTPGRAAQHTEAGILIRRALDIRTALKLGVRITLKEILADEFRALVILEEEQDRRERERWPHGNQ